MMAKVQGFGSKKRTTVADDPKLAAVSLFLVNADPHKEVFLGCARLDKWTIAIIVSDAFAAAPRSVCQEFLMSAGKNYVQSFPKNQQQDVKLALVNHDKTKVIGGYDVVRGAYFAQVEQPATKVNGLQSPPKISSIDP